MVVKKALQKEPERRYSSAETMRKALAESLKKTIEEGATIPGNLPAVDQPPNRRVTAPPAAVDRPEYSPRPAPVPIGPPERLSPERMPPPITPATMAEAQARGSASRWTSLVIIIVVIILIVSLAVGLYFAFIKPSSHASFSPVAQHKSLWPRGAAASIRCSRKRVVPMQREQVKTDHAPAAIGPYSQAIKAGGLVFAAGQIPLDPATGQIVSGDVQAQTTRSAGKCPRRADRCGRFF